MPINALSILVAVITAIVSPILFTALYPRDWEKGTQPSSRQAFLDGGDNP